MFKEVAQIQQLEKRRERLSYVAEQRESLPGKIGTGKLKTAIDIDITIKIGNVRKSVTESAGKLKDSLISFESKAEEAVLETARNYPVLVEQRRSQLAQLSELVADPDTGLTVDDLRIHQQEFEELITLPQTSILFQRGLEKVNEKKDTIGIEPEPKPDIFKFENGEAVVGESGRILRKLFPFGTDHIVSSQELLEEITIDQSGNHQDKIQLFNHRLEEVSPILLTKGLRLSHIHNQNDPKVVAGYYVETFGPNARITLLGDTVRFELGNGTSQIRLNNNEWNLLRTLYNGEPMLESDLARDSYLNTQELRTTAINSLNKTLAGLIGVYPAVISLGDDNFGHWFKVKNISVIRKDQFIPVYPSRQETLRLIFQDHPNLSKQEIINALGKSTARIRAPRELTETQAKFALANAISRLTNRVKENIATEEEVKLHQQMVEYMVKQNLSDRKSLILHVENKLTNTQITSVDKIEPTPLEDPGSIEYVDDTVPIEAVEFGELLSRADIALVAERLESNRTNLETILKHKGVDLIDSEAIFKLVNILTQGQKLKELEEKTVNEQDQYLDDYRRNSFEKAKATIKAPDFGKILEEIETKSLDVWSLLVNLSEINEVLEDSGQTEGIAILAQDQESLGEILVNIISEKSTSNNDTNAEDEIPDNDNFPDQGITVSPPTEAIIPGEKNQKLSRRERRDMERKNIRDALIKYLDEVLREVGDNSLNAWQAGEKFHILKRGILLKATEGEWISPAQVGGYSRYNAADIASLIYFSNNNVLDRKGRKQVYDIAKEEYAKIKKRKTTGKFLQ